MRREGCPSAGAARASAAQTGAGRATADAGGSPVSCGVVRADASEDPREGADTEAVFSADNGKWLAKPAGAASGAVTASTGTGRAWAPAGPAGRAVRSSEMTTASARRGVMRLQ